MLKKPQPLVVERLPVVRNVLQQQQVVFLKQPHQPVRQFRRVYRVVVKRPM